MGMGMEVEVWRWEWMNWKWKVGKWESGMENGMENGKMENPSSPSPSGTCSSGPGLGWLGWTCCRGPHHDYPSSVLGLRCVAALLRWVGRDLRPLKIKTTVILWPRFARSLVRSLVRSYPRSLHWLSGKQSRRQRERRSVLCFCACVQPAQPSQGGPISGQRTSLRHGTGPARQDGRTLASAPIACVNNVGLQVCILGFAGRCSAVRYHLFLSCSMLARRLLGLMLGLSYSHLVLCCAVLCCAAVLSCSIRRCWHILFLPSAAPPPVLRQGV